MPGCTGLLSSATVFFEEYKWVRIEIVPIEKKTDKSTVINRAKELGLEPKTKNKKNSNSKSFSSFFISKVRNIQFGGSMWESNPPMRLPTPNTGFEDQRAHQHPSTPIYILSVYVLISITH